MKKNNLLYILMISTIIIGCNGGEKESDLLPNDSLSESIGENSSINNESIFNNSTNLDVNSDSSSSGQEDGTYEVKVGNILNGSVNVSKSTAKEGEAVYVTLTPDEGYVLEENTLKYNDVLIENEVFYMPNCDVIVTANFVKDIISVPITLMTVSSGNATAYYLSNYTDYGIKVVSYVVDESINTSINDMDKKDGVDFLIGYKSDVKGLDTSTTLRFRADANGYYELCKAVSKGGFGENFDPKLNIAPGHNFYVNFKKQEYSNGTSGYKIETYFGYDLLNTNKEKGLGNITFCPGLVNVDGSLTNITRGQDGYGYYCVWKNSKTFALINQDGSYTQRATGTDEDLLDESALPDNYIYGANFTGVGHWNMTWITMIEPVNLTSATSLIVEVRFNKAINGDWFRLGAATTDNIFYDAFGKDSSTPFRYSCSTDLRQTANYDWEAGQWGGWDPSWNTSIAPTYYVEVPFEYMFARFGLTGNMSETVNTPLSSEKALLKAGIYVTAGGEYDFSIGRIYIRQNGVPVQISNPKNYSLINEYGKNYVYSSKVDSNAEGTTTLACMIYKPES